MGSVQTTLNDAGTVLTNPQYDAWGIVTSAAQPPSASQAGYPLGHRDPSSGFSYLRARWYNPATGTLFGRDPFAGYAESPYSQHPFQYAYADPVSNTDPSGQFCEYVVDPAIRMGCGVLSEFITDVQAIGFDGSGLRQCQALMTIGQLGQVEACLQGNVSVGSAMRHPSMLKWYSRMLDFTPGVGDGKAIGEALIGCDLITGQKLGNWRWLGLLGIIGLGNEAVAPFKHVGSYERTILYHGTNAFAAEEIMNNGFRLSRTGLRGPGVYLTPSIEDALHWANRSGGDTIIKIDLDSHELSNLKLFVEDGGFCLTPQNGASSIPNSRLYIVSNQ